MYGEFKNKILELRSQGRSYKYIKNALGCSKGTISFHCGVGQKEKSRARKNKRRKANPLQFKIHRFCSTINKKINEHHNLSKQNEVNNEKIIKRLRIKVARFFQKKDMTYGEIMFSAKDLLEKIGNNPSCYLTGVPIDLNKPRSYHLDHIVPRSRGGDDSLNNCNIACREANQAKGDLLVSEFVELCKKVIKHNQV
jgi:5-methylcytosine-specific restriction endonuclease McrA